jgi:hypothetical protein
LQADDDLMKLAFQFLGNSEILILLFRDVQGLETSWNYFTPKDVSNKFELSLLHAFFPKVVKSILEISDQIFKSKAQDWGVIVRDIEKYLDCMNGLLFYTNSLQKEGQKYFYSLHLAKCQLLFLLETDVKLICACLDGLETFIDSRMAGLTYNLAACLANRGLHQDAIQLFSRCRRYYSLCITEHSPLVRKLFKPVQGEIQSLIAVKNFAKCIELTNEILVKLPSEEWLAEDNLRQLQCFISLSVVAKTKSENIAFHSICDLFNEWNLDIFEIELKYVSQQGLEHHYFHLLKQGSRLRN